MFDKVYSKDNSENIRIFNDLVEPKNNFSNYSIELNRLFGDKTYAAFYKNLIKHKRAKCSNFVSMFQKPKKMVGIKIYDEPFNIANFEEALNNMKLKREKINYRVNNPYKSRPPINCITKLKTEKMLKNIKKQKLATKYKTNSKLKLHKDNIYLPEVPDVGRYNPSYDVLRKHTYQACFSTSNFHDFNKDNKQFNDRKLFVKINDLYFEEDSNYNKNKIKQISKNANNTINNMSKTETINMSKSNKIKLDKKQKLYLSSSPLFNNRNINNTKRDNNINNNNKEELNNSSNIMSDSQILIRTNGDLNLRCQKHVNNLYNTSSNFSFDDSKMNNSGINNNSIHYINLKKNHCLKFDNYSKRKPIITKLNNTMEHFTNAEAFNLNFPARKKNACIEFNKLSTGKSKQKCFFEFEAKKNKNPPLGAYNPKFDSTFGRITNNIYMNKKNNISSKKRKLQKIMFNYNVPSKYILFQSLNKK